MQVTQHLSNGTPTLRASRALEVAARAGYATKGVVYMLIGGLAVLAATMNGGQVGGGEEAIQTLGSQPFGQVLLILTGVGLVGYALWSFVQAALDPEGKGTDAKGIAKRASAGVNGVVHAALAVAAFQMAVGDQSGGGQTLLGEMMTAPFGRFIVGLFGVAVVIAGFAQLYEAYRARFVKELRTGEMSQTERTWAERAGRAGYAARGIVFPIIGYLIVQAAVTYSPSQPTGVGAALSQLASQSYGSLLLGLVAAGLFAYGVFQLVLAKYRRFNI